MALPSPPPVKGQPVNTPPVKGEPSKRTLAKQAKGRQHVALNALLAHEKDDCREVACREVGLAYRRVRAGKAHPGKAVCMSRLDLAPDSTFPSSWEVVDPNALGKQIVSYERGIFGEGDPRLVATRANGRPLADIR